MKLDLYYVNISNMILSQYQKHGLVKQLKMTVVTFICPIIPYSVKIVKLLTAEVEG